MVMISWKNNGTPNKPGVDDIRTVNRGNYDPICICVFIRILFFGSGRGGAYFC